MNIYDETQRQKDECDDYIQRIAVKLFALLLALGTAYYLFKPQ